MNETSIKKLISVIIPTYNRALDLQRALRSVLAQTYSFWECIVVDNHSDDETESVVSSFNDQRIKFYKIHNQGIIAASRNKGIQHAKGEYIAFLDSDDWWLPQKLTESVRYLDQGDDVVYHDLWCVKKTKQRFYHKRLGARALTSPVYDDLICNGNALPNSSVVVRTELLRNISGLSEDPELVAAEDYEAWCRIAKLTQRFHYISTPLGYYWVGGGNESSAKRRVVNLPRFHSLHMMPYIQKKRGRGSVMWWDYAYARALFLTGNYALARQILRTFSKHRASCNLRFKVVYMKLVMLLDVGKKHHDTKTV